MSDVTRAVRQHYASLIDALMATGQHQQARECAELAVRQGVWSDPLQRPTDYDPALPRRPLYDSADFWFVRYVEHEFPTIRDEVSRVVNPRQQGFSPVEEPLVGTGGWDEVIFYEGGIRMDQSCARFPKTADIMSRIPEAVHGRGVVMLSWLYPATHIVPHCGSTNTKLRVHLGIQVPDGASMRVGDRHFVWEEGRCVVFDDSYEHEVWNRAATPRLVLLFDIAHPKLSPAAQTLRDDPRASFETTVREFLTARGISEIERDPETDELTVVPDQPTARTITRYMKDHRVTRVQVGRGGLVLD